MGHLLLSVTVSLFAATSALAQWVDGELLVKASSTANGNHFLRVDPETGASSVLLTVGYPANGAGSLVYDSYRDAVLLNAAMPPDPNSVFRVWTVPASGSPTAIAAIGANSVHGLCSAGDGRVFYQLASSTQIAWIDAANQAHTLLDATGTAPFSFAVEHLLFHAPTNSLLATTSGWWSTNDCSPTSGSIFRIPLSADGSRVGGTVLCTSIATNSQELMSMDYLPGGQVLLCLASGAPFGSLHLLSTFDPFTLAVGAYAAPSTSNLDGAVYSARIGAAIVLDDGYNVLRRFGPGSTGQGTILPTNLPVSDSSAGYGPNDKLWRIDRNGPACHGGGFAYGTGLPGSGNVAPTLGVVGCPDVGQAFSLAINSAIGGANGMFGVGGGPGNAPLFGGTLLLEPIDALLPIVATGTPGLAGAGGANIPVLVSDPALLGAMAWFQAAFLDPGAVQGVSLTNGLQVVIG